MDRHIETIACPTKETGPLNVRNSEGSVIELRDGRLFMAYSNFYGGGEDFDAADIMGRISEDGGATWSVPYLIQPNDARGNTFIVSLLRLKPEGGASVSGYMTKGDLAIFYLKRESSHTNGIYFRVSRDEGRSWSKELQINSVPTFAGLSFRNDTAIQHSSDRIILPAQASIGGIYGSLMFFSDDYGYTWQQSEEEVLIRERMPYEGYWHPGGVAAMFSYCEEPAIVELKDGRVMLFGRTIMGRIYKAFSSDRGNTWTDPEPTDLASSYSPCTLKRIPSTGDLLCIWNQTSAEEIRQGHGRFRMSLAISKDDGETWEHFKNLESQSDAARITPPPLGRTVDATSEAAAMKDRVIMWKGTKDPLDPKIYHRKTYPHIDYPACCFTSDDHVVITYGVYGGEEIGLKDGNKLVSHPVGWLYE